MSHLNLHIYIHTPQPARVAVKEQFDILGIMHVRSSGQEMVRHTSKFEDKNAEILLSLN